VPYLISGGLGGLGLVVLGAALVVTESHRRDRAEIERRLDEVVAALGRIATHYRVAGNGSGQPGVKVPATAGAPAMVVAGRSSYHAPGCHLVGGRDGDLVPRDEAEETGLDPCRVCNP
jgi:hypothetical protein